MEDGELEKGLGQPLLMGSTETQEDEEDPDCEDSEGREVTQKAANSIGSAYRLLTPSVKVLHFHSLITLSRY